MSSITMNIPTLKINDNQLKNLIYLIYKNENLLKEFGAIKIELDNNCKLALKKRRKNLPLRPILKEINKINSNENIYFVKEIKRSIEENISIKDELSFWSLLSNLNGKKGKELNISFLSNKSFFCSKTSRVFFDIHRLPNQSILKIGGNKLTSKFPPVIRRAHGSASIFPLNSTQYNLFSLNYHHEGGNHYWYIIPNDQRQLLQKLIIEKYSSICLNHGQLFLDPSLLDKYHIRYYRIIQHPNQFVILSSGTLYQYFTDDSSWSESIDFALPSWIQDGYALSLCQCQILSKTIDISLFKNELILKYINSHLTINDKSISYKDKNQINTNTLDEETLVSTNIKLHIPLERINSSLPTTMITPPASSSSSEEDKMKFDQNNMQVQYKLLEEGNFWNAFYDKTSDITLFDSIENDDLNESFTRTNHFCQTNTNKSAKIDQNLTKNSNIDNQFLCFEELMDLVPSNVDNLLSTCEGQVHENMETSSESTTLSNMHTIPFNRSCVKKKQVLDQTINNGRTLFVSGLRSDVNNSKIRAHFPGSIKVTIKKYHTGSHLKYAFILHRTCQQAKRNSQRAINFSLLGPKCHVEYASNCSILSGNHPNFNNKKLVIRRIPENVSEDNLQHLFVNCHILKYCPARTIYPTATTMKMENNNNKILPGYAFILYDNEQQAANVIKHADQYQINDQPLIISLYRDKNYHI